MNKDESSNIEIKNRNDSSFNDVSVKWVSRFDYLPNWMLPVHFHSEYYQMIFIIDGSCTCKIDDVDYLIDKPCILFVRPNSNHGIDNIGKNCLKTLDVKFNINTELLQEKVKTLPSVNFVYEYDYKGLFESIIEEGKDQCSDYQTYCQLLIGLILIKLIRLSTGEDKRFEVTQQLFDTSHISKTSMKLIAFIENNYKRNLKSDDFENEFNMSYRYLSSLTKKEVGHTPTQMVILYRLFIAKELLEYSDMEIKSIAEEVGFVSIHEFSRVFKRVILIPPGEYRKRNVVESGKMYL